MTEESKTMEYTEAHVMSPDCLNDSSDGVDESPWALQSLTIAECAPLYERLKQGLSVQDQILLDISKCDDIDTAGLQFLAAIQNDPEVSLKIRWSRPSETVSMRASRLGLTSWIEAGAVEV